MLDLIIRDASGGRRSLDDAMRLMFSRFGGERGFTGADVERTVGDVCRCDVHPFFEEHVRGNRPIEFDRYLRLIGLRTSVSWIEATDPDGRPTPDLRAYAWQPAEGGAAALGITDPSSCWGKAGLHTGDRIKSFRDTVVTSAGVFRAMIARLRVGDSVAIEVGRPSGPWRTRVVIGGYERPSVRIEEIPGATEGERALRAAWSAGRP
jgi:predicted metalloprotease with PDZ domain